MDTDEHGFGALPARKGRIRDAFGVVFPQTERGSDPVALRDVAQAVEGLGYDDIRIDGVRCSVLPIERRAV